MRLIDADKLIYNDIDCEDGYTYMIVHAPEIDRQPTVEVARWIPISERLPTITEYQENDGRFIASDGNRTYQNWFSIYDGFFITEDNEFGSLLKLKEDKCIIAWQPLPKPYKKGEQ